MKKLLKLLSNRSGATAIEYAIIAGIISIAIVGGITTMGEKTNSSFTTVSQKVWGS